MSRNQNFYQSGRNSDYYRHSSSQRSLQGSSSSGHLARVRARREQKSARLLLFIASIILICLVFIFFIQYSRSKLIPYPIIQDLTPESTVFQDAPKTLYKLPESLEQYEDRLNITLSNLLPGYDCSESHISILYYPTWNEKANLAKLVYTSDHHSAFLVVSTTSSPAPQELFTSQEKTSVQSTDVYFGYTQSPETFYAAWEKEHIYYCLSQSQVSYTSFSNLVETILAA